MNRAGTSPQAVQELFLALRALAPAVRAERLHDLRATDATAAAELAALLSASESNAGFLETPALGAALDWSALAEDALATEHAPPLPARIGKYTIEGLLGRGGMGVVYRATQDAPRRTVALKVLDSPRRLLRFEHEAELLARLQHPGIAQVFEAGTVFEAGPGPEPGRARAFLAMELVPGGDLRAHLGDPALDAAARLALLLRIAEAVAHAHRKGVVHRDLKPENILLDAQGHPKVVDFGVARWLGDSAELATLHTEAGRLVGTPWYMSPEQLAGDPDAADTRSDVHALGVIGYELFAGRLPYPLEGKPLAEVARLVRDTEPAPLPTLARAFPDLGLVLAKCLAKEPERRYGSAAELAADLARVERNEPVSARAPSGVYLLRKFVRRNRALALAAVAALLALLAGVTGVALQARRAARERDRALAAEELAGERLAAEQRERRKFEQGFGFLKRILASVDPNRDGADVRVADVLARAGAEVAGTFPEEPELEADLRRTLGGAWFALGQRERSLAELRAALALLEPRGDTAELALARNDVALLLAQLGRTGEALPLYRAALAHQEATLGAGAFEARVTRSNLARLELQRGASAEAERLYRSVLDGADAPADERFARLAASARRGLASLLGDRGAHGEARGLLERALGDLRRFVGEQDTDVLATLNDLGALEAAAGNLPQAIGHFEECAAGYAALLPPEHPARLTLANNLGTLLVRAGRIAEGEPHLRAAFEGRRATLGPEDVSTLTTAINLADAWLDLGRVVEAEALLAATHDALARTLPAGHWMPHATALRLAECWSRLDRTEDARALVEESLVGLATALGKQAEKTRSAALLLARLEAELGAEERAAALRAEYGIAAE